MWFNQWWSPYLHPFYGIRQRSRHFLPIPILIYPFTATSMCLWWWCAVCMCCLHCVCCQHSIANANNHIWPPISPTRSASVKCGHVAEWFLRLQSFGATVNEWQCKLRNAFNFGGKSVWIAFDFDWRWAHLSWQRIDGTIHRNGNTEEIEKRINVCVCGCTNSVRRASQLGENAYRIIFIFSIFIRSHC